MFKRQTVFVVGAGGSRELGLPMGSELTTNIAQRVKFTFPDGFSPKGGDGDIFYAIHNLVQGTGDRDTNRFWQAGQAIARGMSQAISIDNFLNTHSDNEEIVLMGKLGIATAILEAERKSALAISEHGERLIDFAAFPESWHTVLVKMLLEGASRTDPSSAFENVSIITFNYDRCIERYIHHSLQSYLGLSAPVVDEMMHRLNIIHPYGQVGHLPTSSTTGIRFGAKVHALDLVQVAGQIRTFTERVEDDDMLQKMRDLLQQATVIVYLGFSYGEMNMELMKIDADTKRVVFGTALGVSYQNQLVIKKEIVEAMGGTPEHLSKIELEALTCKDFMYAFWKPILRGL